MAEQGLTTEAKDNALRANFGSNCEVGLTRNGNEISDQGYTAQTVRWSEPKDAGNGRRVTNTNEMIFGPWRNDAPGPVTGWLVKKGNTVLMRQNFAEPRERQRRADEIVIRPGMLTIIQP